MTAIDSKGNISLSLQNSIFFYKVAEKAIAIKNEVMTTAIETISLIIISIVITVSNYIQYCWQSLFFYSRRSRSPISTF